MTFDDGSDSPPIFHAVLQGCVVDDGFQGTADYPQLSADVQYDHRDQTDRSGIRDHAQIRREKLADPDRYENLKFRCVEGYVRVVKQTEHQMGIDLGIGFFHQKPDLRIFYGSDQALHENRFPDRIYSYPKKDVDKEHYVDNDNRRY